MRRHIGRDSTPHLQHYKLYKAHCESEGIKMNELCIPNEVKIQTAREQGEMYVSFRFGMPFEFALTFGYLQAIVKPIYA